jgi:hypothetical protein
MARYDETKVPRGTSRRWEVLVSDDAERRPSSGHQRSALEVKRDHRVLHALPDEMLRGIPLLREGGTLVRRREYIDLHDPARADFRAEADQFVRPGQRVVARDEVSPEAWAELRDACDRVLGRRPLRRAS